MEFDRFDWDRGNKAKCQKHGMSIEAIENVFAGAIAISRRRKNGRRQGVFIVFTLRKRGAEVLLRPISARYMHAKEVRNYEKENPELQKRS